MARSPDNPVSERYRMARRTNYGFDKRVKELKKKKKREEKLERKRMKKQGAQNESEGTPETPAGTTGEETAPDGSSERREDEKARPA